MQRVSGHLYLQGMIAVAGYDFDCNSTIEKRKEKRGKNFATGRNFFTSSAVSKGKKFALQPEHFGASEGSYLEEILLLFKLPCFPTVKFAAVNPNDFVNWDGKKEGPITHASHHHYTAPGKICRWLREICSCSCLTFCLVLLNMMCIISLGLCRTS